MGVIHAFERFIQLYNTGNGNMPGIMLSSARAYEDIKTKKCTASKKNYLNGLIYRFM